MLNRALNGHFAEELHLSKALFSLDPDNLQLHCFLGLETSFCCSFFAVSINHVRCCKRYRSPPPPPPPILAMYNFHPFRRGSGTILSTFPRIPITYLLISFVNRCYRVTKWSIGRKEESASRECEVRYRDPTPSSIFVSALYPTWEPARMLNNTESFRTALT